MSSSTEESPVDYDDYMDAYTKGIYDLRFAVTQKRHDPAWLSFLGLIEKKTDVLAPASDIRKEPPEKAELIGANQSFILPNNPTLRAKALKRPEVLTRLPVLEVQFFQLPWVRHNTIWHKREYDKIYENWNEITFFARFVEQDMRFFYPPDHHLRPRVKAKDMPLWRAQVFFRSRQPSTPPPPAPPSPPQPSTPQTPPQPSTLPAPPQPSTSPTTAPSNSPQPNTAPSQEPTRQTPPHIRIIQLSRSPAAAQPSTTPAAAQPSTTPAAAQPNTSPAPPQSSTSPAPPQSSTSPAPPQQTTTPIQGLARTLPPHRRVHPHVPPHLRAPQPTRPQPPRPPYIAPHLRALQPNASPAPPQSNASPAPPQSNTSPAPPEPATPPYVLPHLRVPQPTTPPYVLPHLRRTRVTATTQPTSMSQPALAPSMALQPITQPAPAPPAPAQTITATQPRMPAQQMFDANHKFREGIYPNINPTLVCPCNLMGHHCRHPVRDNYTHDGKTLCDLVEVCTSEDCLDFNKGICDAPYHSRPTCRSMRDS